MPLRWVLVHLTEKPQATGMRPVSQRTTLSLASIFLVYWVLVKAVLFEHLEYTSDVFSFLQDSRSFADGRPFLYDNAFGYVGTIHNFYVVPFFYPLTVLLNAYGLFIGLALLWLLALFAIRNLASDADERKQRLYLITTFGLLLGPVSFYLWDDPIYGWHPDLCLLPLSVLFIVCLIRGSRWVWIPAALITLINEQGAVAAWTLHVVFEVTRGMRSGRLRRLLLITTGWLLVFGAGMVVLTAVQHIHGVQEGRLEKTLLNIELSIRNGSLALVVAKMVWGLALLLASGAIVHLAGIPTRGLWIACLCMVPPFVVCAIEGFAYWHAGLNEVIRYGPVWPPRMVMFWALLTAQCLLTIHYAKPDAISRRVTRERTAFALGLAIAAQVLVLALVPDCRWLRRFTAVWSTGRFMASNLTYREDEFLKCLGERLPRSTGVASTGSLFGRFDRQYIVWPEDLGNAWRAPELIVCDKANRVPWDNGCLRLLWKESTEWDVRTQEVDELAVAYLPGLKGLVLSCNR